MRESRCQTGVMESDDENEMVERFRGASLSLRNDKGPVWDGRRRTWRAFWYDMYVFLKCCNDGKLVKTVDGEDREDRLAADETVRNAYARRNLLVWRYMIRSIDKQCRTAKAVRLMIIDDFREDHDGYELIQYLSAYANEQSDTDVDKLRARIEKMTFKTSESPARWGLTVQLLRQRWLGIPEDQRGGGDKQLISLLLKKVGAASQNYVSYVRAFLHARDDEGSGDYQGIAKMLIDQHRQFYVGDSEEEGSSDEGEGAKRATTKRAMGSAAAGEPRR